MKSLFPILFLLFFNLSCFAQAKINHPADVFVLAKKQNDYLGKPLSNVLKDINIPIKFVMPEPVGNPIPRLVFRFISIEEQQDGFKQNNSPYTVMVQVSEPFEWDYEARRKTGEMFKWKNEDAERLKNLTVVSIRAYGAY